MRGGKTNSKTLPRAKSTQLNHYVRLTSDEFQYNAAIVYVRINSILQSKSENGLKESPNNIIGTARPCRSYSIGKIFISSILPSRKTSININSINDTLKQLCHKNNFAFIVSIETTSNELWEASIHLVEDDKVLFSLI